MLDVLRDGGYILFGGCYANLVSRTDGFVSGFNQPLFERLKASGDLVVAEVLPPGKCAVDCPVNLYRLK